MVNNQEQRFQEEIQKLDLLIKQKMTRDALSRYGNIKSAHPQKTFELLLMFAQLMQKREIKTIDDSMLKTWLLALNQNKKIKSFTIKRK